MHGSKDAGSIGTPGGKFSLGRLRKGSGYCVGAVVETQMGLREESFRVGEIGKRGKSVAGNGMRDVWVVGEGFFRGVAAVFDFKEQKVGFHSY